MSALSDRTMTSSGFYVTKEAPIETNNPVPTPSVPAPDILVVDEVLPGLQLGVEKPQWAESWRSGGPFPHDVRVVA